MSNNDIVKCSITISGETYTTELPFIADGINDEHHIGRAIASCLAAIGETGGNLCTSMLFAAVAQSYPSPRIIAAAGEAYEHFDMEPTGQDGWEVRIDRSMNSHKYKPERYRNIKLCKVARKDADQ